MTASKPKDWYAIGQIFGGPFHFDNPGSGELSAQKYGVSVGVQVLAAMDVASGVALHGRPIAKVPGPYIADEILEFLKEVFEMHGKPNKGVVISKSVWQSSHEMLLNDEMSARGELLKQLDIDIGPMDAAEKSKLAQAVKALALQVEFDDDKFA